MLPAFQMLLHSPGVLANARKEKEIKGIRMRMKQQTIPVFKRYN
jgi:hypothetical protein